ncbi:MAG: MBL fold metallo-hydrolase [Spirochaetales bacterium]|nr:MBL fold metallo-hydrolase [Spirochaetales bacterium]
MQITVLGYWGAYPAAGEATSGYLFQDRNTNILLDCGSAVLSELQKHIDISNLDAVILSHYHADHVADIHCLQYAVMLESLQHKRDRNLPIYAYSKHSQFETLTFEDYTEGIALREESEIAIGDFSFSFIKTVHPEICMAVKITHYGKTAVYTADTEYFDKLTDFSRYADILLCEASLYREYEGKVEGHMSGAQAGKLAAEADVGALLLTHLPRYGNHERLREEAGEYYRGNITLARTALKIRL